MHSDYHFIESLLADDNRGISGIYDRFAPGIARFVVANSGTQEDARDVFQEALMTIARQARKPGFALTCPFEAYLFMVCRARWLNELQRRKRAAVTLQQTGGYAASEEAHALAEETLREEARDRLLRKCFDTLSASCRRLLQLAWTPGLSMQDVAAQLGISYGYARKQKTECLAKLVERVRLSPEFAALK